MTDKEIVDGFAIIARVERAAFNRGLGVGLAISAIIAGVLCLLSAWVTK